MDVDEDAEVELKDIATAAFGNDEYDDKDKEDEGHAGPASDEEDSGGNKDETPKKCQYRKQDRKKRNATLLLIVSQLC